MEIRNILKTLGPGILFAGAAIGGSHLIQSTRAGATFGFDLLLLVILINLFKYPFFEYGQRYVAATGESLLEGYMKLGKWAVYSFFVLNIITAIVNAAAVTLVTVSLAANLFNLSLSTEIISFAALSVTLLVLFLGKYSLLDLLMKVMIFVLAITTVITVIVASGKSTAANSVAPELWNTAGISFLLALMGWMPAPIESSVWPSLWALERKKQTGYTPNLKESLFDFNIGYIGTTIMALFFVCLGALVMFGSGETFSNSGVIFSSQLVALYTKTIGDWSEIIISLIVLITMISTILTVFDAYPRTLAGLSILIFPGRNNNRFYWFYGIVMALLSAVIISFFSKGMKSLLDVATIISFLAAPVFAFINYKVITSENFPEEFQPSGFMKILSWCGIIFLVSFSLIYIYTRIFI